MRHIMQDILSYVLSLNWLRRVAKFYKVVIKMRKKPSVDAKKLVAEVKQKRAKNMKDESITFRLPPDLKADFVSIAKKNKTPISKLLIRFVESFVESNQD